MSEEQNRHLASISRSLEKLVAISAVSAVPSESVQLIIDRFAELYRTEMSLEHQIFAISAENNAPFPISFKLNEVKTEIAQMKIKHPAVVTYMEILAIQ
jgi:hypothetical protein